MFSYFSYLEYLSKIVKKKFPKDFNLNFERLQKDIVLICSRSRENFWKDLSLKNISEKKYKDNCFKIRKHVIYDEPIPYITRRVSFYGSDFSVSKGVFIPQSDTELIVTITNLLSEKIWDPDFKVKFLEIGTGTGVIPISLSFNCKKKHWSFVSTDINKKATCVAKKNSYSKGIKNINFISCENFPNVDYKFDILVSNPPYISSEKYWSLPNSTKKQPKKSLLAGKDGLFFYYKIISNSSYFLKKKFLMLLEIDNYVLEEVKKMLNFFFPLSKIETFKDFSGNWRVISCYKI